MGAHLSKEKEHEIERTGLLYAGASLGGVLALAYAAIHTLALKLDLPVAEAEKQYLDEVADCCSLLVFGALLGLLIQSHVFQTKVINQGPLLAMLEDKGLFGVTFTTTALWALFFCGCGVVVAKYMLPSTYINRWAVTDWRYKEYLDEVADCSSILTVGLLISLCIYQQVTASDSISSSEMKKP